MTPSKFIDAMRSFMNYRAHSLSKSWGTWNRRMIAEGIYLFQIEFWVSTSLPGTGMHAGLNTVRSCASQDVIIPASDCSMVKEEVEP